MTDSFGLVFEGIGLGWFGLEIAPDPSGFEGVGGYKTGVGQDFRVPLGDVAGVLEWEWTEL